MRKMILNIFLILVLAYMGFCTIAYVFPEYFYYHPSQQHPNIELAHQNGYALTEVHYNSADGTKLFGWMSLPECKQKPETKSNCPLPSNKMVLFLHGNAYDISGFFLKTKPFADLGYGTFLAEYRGFGGIKGQISEKNLVADSIAAVKYLNSLGYKNEDIIVYGLSLGSHTATKTVASLNAQGNFDALILEVPFDSLTKTAQHHVPFYVPDFVIRDSYDNIAPIKNINTRVLIQAGGLDTLVPVERAKNLFAHALEPKDIKIYPHAGHNDLLSFDSYKDIIEWLEYNG